MAQLSRAIGAGPCLKPNEAADVSEMIRRIAAVLLIDPAIAAISAVARANVVK